MYFYEHFQKANSSIIAVKNANCYTVPQTIQKSKPKIDYFGIQSRNTNGVGALMSCKAHVELCEIMEEEAEQHT